MVGLYNSLIYNYLCNQCPSSLTLWVRIPLHTTLCYKVSQWLAAGRWLSPGTLVSSTNKTDRHDITEILLKVALNTITLTPNPIKVTNLLNKLFNFLQISFYTCPVQWGFSFFISLEKKLKIYKPVQQIYFTHIKLYKETWLTFPCTVV